jgi:hypothetical protein
MPVLTPNFQDREWDLLYKAVADLEPYVTNFVSPNYQDRTWDLLYKLSANISNINAASGGTPAVVVEAPSGINDFSVLPGGVAPTGDEVFFAPRDAGTLWTIAGGDTQWTIIDKNNP